MKKEKISKAISMIDDDILEEANEPRLHKPNFMKYMTVAACFVIAVCVTFSYVGTIKPSNGDSHTDDMPPNAIIGEVTPTVSVEPSGTFSHYGNENTSDNEIISSSEQYHYFDNTLTVLQREDESIVFELNDAASNYDITLNVTSPDGKEYVFSTDLTKNTLFTGDSVEIYYGSYSEWSYSSSSTAENVSNRNLIKVNYENLLKNGYTVDDHIIVSNFGEISLK